MVPGIPVCSMRHSAVDALILLLTTPTPQKNQQQTQKTNQQKPATRYLEDRIFKNIEKVTAPADA